MATFYILDSLENVLELTSTTSIQVNEKSTATNHKVEDGFKISDNIVVENVKISFDGIISDIRSISFSGQDQNPNRRLRERVTEVNYIRSLRRLKESKEPFSVVYDVGMGVHTNCVLTNFSITKDSSIGLGWKVSLSFEQIRISERAKISSSVTVQRSSDLTQEKTNSGGGTTANADEKVIKNFEGDDYELASSSNLIFGEAKLWNKVK